MPRKRSDVPDKKKKPRGKSGVDETPSWKRRRKLTETVIEEHPGTTRKEDRKARRAMRRRDRWEHTYGTSQFTTVPLGRRRRERRRRNRAARVARRANRSRS